MHSRDNEKLSKLIGKYRAGTSTFARLAETLVFSSPDSSLSVKHVARVVKGREKQQECEQKKDPSTNPFEKNQQSDRVERTKTIALDRVTAINAANGGPMLRNTYWYTLHQMEKEAGERKVTTNNGLVVKRNK
jgi:hypothetical protein